MTHDIIWLDTIDSTNNEAKRRFGELGHMSVIAAREQTAGRGQRGKIWLSPAGLNLTFSIVMKYGNGMLPSIQPVDQSVINDIISFTIVELLSRYGIEAWVKPPNDIYVDKRKICGILIEHSVRGDSLLHSIVGVGLNVNQREFDGTLPNPTSIVLESNFKEIDTYVLLEELLDIFLKHTKEKLTW